MWSRVLRRWIAVAVAVVLGVSLAGVAGSAQAAARGRQVAVPPVASAAGQFYSARGRVATAVKITAGATATMDVTGVGGVPGSGVASVAFNIAVRGETAGPGQLIVYASGAAAPTGTTAVRYRTTIYTHNLVTAKVGADGNVRVFNDGPVPAIVYADVHGYTLTAPGGTAGSTFVGLRPARIVQAANIPANGTYTVAPLGQGGIPAAGVSHAVFTFNVKSADTGKLTVYPSGTTRPADTNLDYGLGLWMQNHVFARLGADGRVSITNIGAKAVNFDLHVTGYFATPQAAVAGTTLQVLPPARLLNGHVVGADTAFTLAPLGAGGVPATGVDGVAIAITTQGTGTLPANLRVYPSGTGGTAAHAVAAHTNKQFYSGFITAKLGYDGQVAIFNNGPEATRIWVDVFGYFRTPPGCSQTAAQKTARKVTQRVGADPQEYAPTNAVQASQLPGAQLGTIEYTYVDNLGQLRHGHQVDPGDFHSVQWTALEGLQAFTGMPGLAEQADGRLQITAHNTSGSVWSLTQTTKDPPLWGTGTDNGGYLVSHTTLARHDDTLVAFAVAGDGGLWALPQYTPNTGYTGWIYLGMAGLSTATTPVVVPVADGLQVFALSTTGAWRTALYAHGTLSRCATISQPGFSGQPSVVVYPGSRLQVFVRDPSGSIVAQKQDGAGNWPQTWTPVGTFTAAGSPAAVIHPISGRSEVVARGSDGVIYGTSETAQGSAQWGNWVDTRDTEQGDTTISATDPTAFKFTGTNGPIWAFVIRTANQVHRAYVRKQDAARLRAAAPPGFTPHTLPTPPRTR